MYKLTFEAVKTAFEATGGTVDKTKASGNRNGYMVTFPNNDKAYNYAESMNLFTLAKKLKVLPQVVGMLDKVNAYNESIYKTIESNEKRLADMMAKVPGQADENDFFGFAWTTEEIEKEIANIKYDTECMIKKLEWFDYTAQ